MIGSQKALAAMICKDDQIIKLTRRVAELERESARLRNKIEKMRVAEGIAVKPEVAEKLNAIAESVASDFGVSLADIMGRSQRRDISHARQAVMYWANQESGISARQIGAFFKMDHSTILYGIRTAEERWCGL